MGQHGCAEVVRQPAGQRRRRLRHHQRRWRGLATRLSVPGLRLPRYLGTKVSQSASLRAARRDVRMWTVRPAGCGESWPAAVRRMRARAAGCVCVHGCGCGCGRGGWGNAVPQEHYMSFQQQRQQSCCSGEEDWTLCGLELRDNPERLPECSSKTYGLSAPAARYPTRGATRPSSGCQPPPLPANSHIDPLRPLHNTAAAASCGPLHSTQVHITASAFQVGACRWRAAFDELVPREAPAV